MRPEAVEAGGLALSKLSGPGESASAGTRLPGESDLPDVFRMRRPVAQGALALSELPEGGRGGQPGAKEGTTWRQSGVVRPSPGSKWRRRSWGSGKARRSLAAW